MRKGSFKRKNVVPDPKYNDVLVSRFVNNIMMEGKKSRAYEIFYKTIDLVSEKTGENGLDVWRKALENVTPSVEVQRRRVGGATLQIPVEIYPFRRTSLGIKWLIQFARQRGEKTMVEKLAKEIIDASQEEGKAIKKKQDVHKMAASSKAYASLQIR